MKKSFCILGILTLALAVGSTTAFASRYDRDEDGYSRWNDCNDLDAAINPGAAEVCGDGVDQNCDGVADEGCGTAGGTGSHAGLSWSDYPSACIGCHADEANDMFNSAHYKWVGEAPDMTNQTGVLQGKLTNAVNSYCINVLGDWKLCGKCHAGRGLRPDDPRAGLENIDCLVCHNADYPMVRDRQADGSMAPPAGTAQATLDGYVRNISKPTRKNCLKCHANAGGGDAVKRGDLAMANIGNSDPEFDVHMNTGGTDFACQTCHLFQNHKVMGKGSDLRPTDDLNRGAEIKCVSCHSGKDQPSGHSSRIGQHVDQVACQVCHIPTYAKVATETHRDWTHHHDGSPADGSTGPGHPRTEKAADLIPAYKWWNRTSNNALLGDNAYLTYDAAKGTYPTSRPQGAFYDGVSKIYPFKYKTANQPMVTADGALIALNTLVYLGTTGNIVEAIQDGLVNMGYSADEPYNWVTTDTYQLINHGVEPRANALNCSSCHDGSGQSNLRLPFNELGYHTWPAKVKNCTLCHEQKSLNWQSMHDKHAEKMGKTCVSCHTTEPTGWVEPPTRNGLCNNCHSGRSYENAGSLHKEHVKSEGGSMKARCTDCHTF